MFRAPDRDDVCDALALIQAAHEVDPLAARVIMENANLVQVVAVLAKVAADLVADVALIADEPAGELMSEMQRNVRRAHKIET
jgi:hypothetical protein